MRLVAILGLALALTACRRTPHQKHDRYMKLAEDATEAGKIREAAFYLRYAAAAVPNDANAHYRLGLSYLRLSQARPAVNEFKRTLELDPANADAQLKLSLLYASAGGSELVREAEARTKALVAASPNNTDALQALAIAEFRLGEQESAFHHLEAAIERAPQELRPSVSLARLKLKTGDAAGGESVLRQAVDRDPNSAAAVVVLGMYYAAEKKAPEAEAAFRRALELSPAAGGKDDAKGRVAREGALLQLAQLLMSDKNKLQPLIVEMEEFSASHPDDRAVRTRLIQAYNASGREADAAQYLSRIIQKNPKDAEALEQRAEWEVRRGYTVEAERDLTQALQFRPDAAPIHFLIAAVAQAKGEVQNERRELLEAIRLSPTMLAARIALADAYLRDKDPKAALDALDRAPEQVKALPRFQVARNAVLLAAGKYGEAEKSLDAGLASKPTPALRMQKAALLFGNKHFDEARGAYRQVLALSPENIAALQGIAQTYAAQGQREAALKTIAEAARENPQSADRALLLANWQVITGKRDEARASLLHAQQLDPKREQVAWALARLDFVEGRLPEARKEATAAIEANPMAVPPRQVLAQVEMVENKPAAVAQYRKILELAPRDLLALNNLAFLLADDPHQLDEAVRSAEDVVRLAPNVAAYQDTLGWLYYRRGTYQEAVRHLREAVEKEPTPRHKYHLAMSYFRFGKSDLGKKEFEEASHLDPALPERVEAERLLTQAGK
jgi:Flp pilus assembly protein TadD